MPILADTANHPKKSFRNVCIEDNILIAFIFVVHEILFSHISSEASAA
jgi:hypothetical protein